MLVPWQRDERKSGKAEEREAISLSISMRCVPDGDTAPMGRSRSVLKIKLPIGQKGGQSSQLLLLKGEFDGDIAARGVGIGADLMGEFKEFLAGGGIYSRQRETQFDFESKPTLPVRPNAHSRGDGGLTCIHMFTLCNSHKSRLEAGRVPDGKELFGIGALT